MLVQTYDMPECRTSHLFLLVSEYVAHASIEDFLETSAYNSNDLHAPTWINNNSYWSYFIIISSQKQDHLHIILLLGTFCEDVVSKLSTVFVVIV